MDEQSVGPGQGPWVGPWPDDPRLDPDLLKHGDHRNVVDEYRFWKVEAIVEDLDSKRHPMHVAIENLEHDFNIGSIVRTANARMSGFGSWVSLTKVFTARMARSGCDLA